MVLTFLYCIDYPDQAHKADNVDQVIGWLFCSNNIISVKIPELLSGDFVVEYGLPRPDVIKHFKRYSDSDKCGFSIMASKEFIDLKNEFILEVEVKTEGRTKNVAIAIDLNSSGIQEIEIDDNKNESGSIYKETETKLIKTLKKHPWLTIRMDITNKCNLRCIMCHYKEKDIYSRQAKNITADQLKHYLKDIGPFVKHIMLSCGFEPLMSKHFSEIVSMLHDNYPHMEIAICTNGMLMDSKIRKVIIENNITHVILSLDGTTRQTLERIRAGADYGKIVGNIKALHNLKLMYKRNFPVMFMDFVLMNSNIHEAPAFVQLCAELGIDIIDFRHLVGNIFFSEHEEMLANNKEKYNYFRPLIIAEGKKYNMKVRLPEPFNTVGTWVTENIPDGDLSDFNSVLPDFQTEEITNCKEFISLSGKDSDFAFLSGASCLRPFNEIMIVDQQKILPCSYYNDSMGNLDEDNTLYSIFFNEKFRKVRQRKLLSRVDHNCMNCPIMMNLLPTEIVR